MNTDNFEIERKFLIEYPSAELLSCSSGNSDISQIYLVKSKSGMTERIRKRVFANGVVYTHTIKARINDIRRIEIENEISEAEFNELRGRAAADRNIIYKKRYIIEHNGQSFEIDIYPFWSDRAIMELELEKEAQEIIFPPLVRIIKEVTADRRYTNASLSQHIPNDPL